MAADFALMERYLDAFKAANPDKEAKVYYEHGWYTVDWGGGHIKKARAKDLEGWAAVLEARVQTDQAIEAVEEARAQGQEGNTLLIEGCTTCPFAWRDNQGWVQCAAGWYLGHLEPRGFYDEDGRRAHSRYPQEPPTWCPLRLGSCTLMLVSQERYREGRTIHNRAMAEVMRHRKTLAEITWYVKDMREAALKAEQHAHVVLRRILQSLEEAGPKAPREESGHDRGDPDKGKGS